MNISGEALVATLKAVFDKSQPWEVDTVSMKYQHSGQVFTFTHYYRRADAKALVVRLVMGWGRVFISLTIDAEKADADETEIGDEVVQQIVNILARRLRPRPVNFVVLSLSGESGREICWE
ncbi:MAG: hypothetical protein KA314_04640 [Chloroflexi bacterium]|nr:hypothetical protein [Chloroflexota bacterium]